MKFNSTLCVGLNILARIVGLVFTAVGLYYFTQGVFLFIQPETGGVKDTLGFAPSFRLFVIAFVCLAVGVHFIRGETHRPDRARTKESGNPDTLRPQSWWTGNYSKSDPNQNNDPRSDSEKEKN